MNTRKKGGRFIGQGTYGCVFGSPPLQCKDKKRSTNKVISKLLDTYSANEEYADGLMWKEVDPRQEFSIWAEEICPFDPKDVIPADEPELCTSNAVKPVIDGIDRGKLILYPYGGVDLSKLKLKSIYYIHILYGFYKLLGGFTIAHHHNVIHLDVKEPNIVCEIKEDSVLFRLIDFGLSIKTNTLKKKDRKLSVYTSPYLYWPFELACINPRMLESSYKGFYKTIKYYPKYFPARSYFNELGEPYPYAEFKKYVESAKLLDYTTLLRGVDVYSVGLLITKFVYNMFHHRIDRNNNVIVDGIAIPSAWHKDVITHISTPLLHLAMKMVERDPSKRVSMAEAKKDFKKIIPKLTTYLKPKDIQLGLRGMNILGLEPTYKNIPTPVLPLTPSLRVAELDELFAKQTIEDKLNKDKLENIYKISEKFPKENSELIKIARTLGSRKSFIGKTKVSVINDIIKKGEKQGLNLKF